MLAKLENYLDGIAPAAAAGNKRSWEESNDATEEATDEAAEEATEEAAEEAEEKPKK